jgi:hypothetical protein
MSNEKRSTIFYQSLRDFPCPITLGKKSPAFGLHRFKQGLRFVPLDDEGFTLSGDKRRLLYKGRRRSHRFTILGDTAFEYDCILLKEPESNVISLRMEGAENFDFFRQPDFLKEPLLAGSYAVYKKETMIGEGTGKLCHIHRPEIIDARGRRCWGILAVVGDMLHITIPEKWLADAKYPVVVDPTIGTTTVGSQYKWDADPPEPWVQLMFEGAIVVNRFLVSDTINGSCTAYMYSYVDNYDDAGGRPVLYSDNGNSPLTRKSKNENFADFTVNRNKPAGWRSSTFQSNGAISSGSYIWFGVFCDFFWEPRFDYGAKCYSDDWYMAGNSIPNTFPIYNVNWYFDFRLSMYFTYTSAQNYVRTITQGVSLSDTRKLTGNYKRNLSQTAGVYSLLKRFETFYRKCVMTVYNSMSLNRLPVFIRRVAENINVTMDFFQSLFFTRKCNDGVNANSQTNRKFSAIRKVQDALNIADNNSISIIFLRRLPDDVQITQTFRHWGAFIRGLRVNAESIAETSHNAEYYRFTSDTALAVGTVFRGLLLYVRIVSKVFVRDYILRRFLKAKEDFILKSPICTEIILDSKID